MDKVNMGEWESRLINELVQGRELARRLQMCLHEPSSSQETRDFLIQSIIAAFERALATVNFHGGSSSVGEPSNPTRVGLPTSESPPFSGSPRSEDSDRDFQDQNASKKRRSMPRWTKQIRVSPGMAVEGTLDDGYSWRKYGQKDILGAKFPRGYYRCTHRNVQGCLATKQVQRSDEDPNIFEITYRGKHTCAQSSYNAVPPSGTQETHELNHPNAADPHQEQLLVNLRAGLRVQTDNLDIPDPHQSSFTSLILGSTSSILNHQNQMFTSSSMLENNFAENLTSSYPSYMSPATSAVTYFSANNMSLAEMPNMATSGSEINDTISAVTSAANSPTVGFDLPFDQFGYDGHNFTFDNHRFF
ncbi:hypothetical protein K1719_025872 [Acacia pycnantha]|nr:hypothetical protein K1719_025872 [Acacia pycnantha]